MLPSSPSGGSRLCESGDWVGMIFAQVEPLPYEANFMDLDPDVKDPLGLPVVRVTYSLQDNEVAAQNYILKKLEEIMTRMGATQTWPSYPPGSPCRSTATPMAVPAWATIPRCRSSISTGSPTKRRI